ncbi:hypothetical protein K435DRAFT_888456 [Dendrothele bispora CBS 962.96]|uniref:Uncharacterized protein n=1 Tax=Dendrothele bispora (strain CBS 962.96) TaxID=1314807 RepID=A0A4S8MT26_DENBC|nr:hypothetical protein K435DRAFT_888456 [Dendrothele bispora CBS 962.96]
MSVNRPSSPPVPGSGTHFFHGTTHSQFDNMTLNNVGGNQNHDRRAWSRDTIHHNSRSFATINGGYTENDNRRMRRNIENVQTYHEYQGSRGNSTRISPFAIFKEDNYSEETKVTTTTQLSPRSSSNRIPLPDRSRENDNARAPFAIGHNSSQAAIRQDREAALQSLPQDVRGAFTACFIPAIIELTGTLRAWADPSTDQIRDVWSAAL